MLWLLLVVYCEPGEACLWYSWQLSPTEVSVSRECLSTSILLGSIEDPLVVTAGCSVKDISEGTRLPLHKIVRGISNGRPT